MEKEIEQWLLDLDQKVTSLEPLRAWLVELDQRVTNMEQTGQPSKNVR